ncbi:vomeronasal type-1 receptor 4 [Ictidomys tridecemlineatus]|uniref:vomeronasal type-1 receptor 4-like n=1 Tax=Ictidomys tridecemlineatus TaxID=43179 RepID=UPI000B53C1D8|nr:vomeronasal type-1 receptor 4-like [Ictidomys tridecemlineatus]KAG3255689.1 vomeronasal type-1 receptor 4-like [Ictidomys tridecemlineatus]
MASGDLTLGVVFLSQTVVGILGNFCLLSSSLCLYCSGCRFRCTDWIIRHLTAANFLFLLFRGVPQTMAALGFRHFFSDLGCKLVFYVHRVGRGMSFSSTCLLSVFQAITISPRDSRWAELQGKAPRYTGTSVLLCWILHLLVNIIVPVHVTANRGDSNMTQRKEFGYCSDGNYERNVYAINSALLSFPDVLCLGIMPWASGSMVLILYRHKQRFQHLHGLRPSRRSSAESRATETVLLLVSTFMTLYTLSFTMHIWWGISGNVSELLVHLSALTNASFPALSPFILMSRDTNVSRLCWSRTSPSVLRNM